MSSFKVVLVGDSGVGKTSLSNMFVKQEFNPTQPTTMGAAFQTKHLKVNGRQITFNIWDTAGQEQFKAIVGLYYRDAQVALIVYDITSYRSFERCKSWVKELNEKGPKNIIKVLVGNKVDLIDSEEVKYDEASKYARGIEATLKLTSAKENKGIEELFTQIGERLTGDIVQQQQEEQQQQTQNFQQVHKLNDKGEDEKTKKKNCSC